MVWTNRVLLVGRRELFIVVRVVVEETGKVKDPNMASLPEAINKYVLELPKFGGIPRDQSHGAC